MPYDGYRREVRYATKEIGWTLRRFFFMIIGFSILASIVGYASGWFKEAGQVAQEQFGPRGALSKYEWFRDKNESIIGVKIKTKNAKADLEAFTAAAGPRDKWTFEDKQEWARLSAVATATKNILSEMVAEYNANSKKFNYEAFRANDLPQVQKEED